MSAECSDRIKRTMPPLRGVIHAAGVRDDGVIGELELAAVRAVMAPKVAGTWHLHESHRGSAA